MARTPATLHMLCGKIASGKSTLAEKLRHEDNTILISEDAWLSVLYAEQMSTPRDFMRYSARLRAAMGPHITELLNAGVSVVLDFQANTVEARAWMRGILDATDAAHQLHVMTTPEDVCLKRLHARNAGGDHPFAATEQQFHMVSKYFVAPAADEGFTIVTHDFAD